MPDKTPTRLDRYRELLAEKVKIKKKVVDERYVDVVSPYEEPEEERFLRVMNDPRAWTN